MKLKTNYKINWSIEPYPHAVIDNFLPIDLFKSLNNELNKTNNLLQSKFKTPLENKSIYKNTFCKKIAQDLIKTMGSNELKEIISQQIGDVELISMGDKIGFAGYSPYHVTINNGYLGSHVDHSYIENGNFRHVANTIFYASNKWEKGWGGETILFSRNGFRKKVIIEPVPNRMVIFIHTANSFHGVQKYMSTDKTERRTFYHDYYVKEGNIKIVMDNLNINRKSKLTHSFHGTTFIPLCPFGLEQLKFKTIFNPKNIKYMPTYIIYLTNRYLGTQILSIRSLIKHILKIIRVR